MTDENGRITLWLFITALVVGGAERTLVELVNGLEQEAYEVTVWTIFDYNPLAVDLPDHVEVRTLGVTGIISTGYVERPAQVTEYVRAPLRFLGAARREQPDIIQSFVFFDNIIARLATLVCSATVITGVRSVPNDQHRLRALLDQLTLPLSDVVVSNSTAGAEFAVDRGAAEEDVIVIRNGRPIERFQQPSTSGIRSALSVSSEAPIVGTVGRLIERKGCHDLAAAWPSIQDRFPRAHLLFVGDGPERAALEDQAERDGCRDSIHFLGTREDVPELLSCMDVFAFPSHYEGLPGALIEAMAAGLPIVTTPVGGNVDLVDNFRTGLFVSERAPRDLAWAVIRLLEYRQLADSLGDAAARRAEQEFTTTRMVEQFHQLYQRVNHSPPER